MRQVFQGIGFVLFLMTVCSSAMADRASYFDRYEVTALEAEGDAEVFNQQLRRFAAALENRDLEEETLALEAALVLGKGKENPKFLADISMNLARLYEIRNEFTKADDTYELALKHYWSINGEEDVRMIEPLYEYTKFSVRRKTPVNARGLFDQLERLVTLHFYGDTVETAQRLLLEADLHRIEANLKVPGEMRWTRVRKMRKSLKLSRKMFIKVEDFSGAADSFFLAAEMNNEARMGRAAIGDVNKAIALYEQAGVAPGDARMIRCHAHLAQMHYRLDGAEKAQPHVDFVTANQTAVDDSELIPLYRIPPVYPLLARAFKKKGWVLVEFIIDVDGSITSAQVVESELDDVFNKAALEAVRQWRYIPVEQDGHRVEVKTKGVLNFVLSDGKDAIPVDQKQFSQ